jgi:hypothetical protein
VALKERTGALGGEIGPLPKRVMAQLAPGIFRLTNLRAKNRPIGCTSFVYAFGASTVGAVTTSLSGQYSADGAACG